MTGDATELNRAHWDALAGVHGEGDDSIYDVEALADGRRGMLRAEEEAVALAVGDVAGRDVLHLQCHLGFDAVTLARRGARVTGADFSAAALAKARAIAQRCGVEVEYVEADATALPASLQRRFDLVYATVGVLGWIGDLDAWMRSAASALRPGGRLVLVEIHPLYAAVGSLDPLVLDFPYADAGPQVFDEEGSYANPQAAVAATRTVEHAHSIGEVVTAALAAGLRVEALREHLEVERDPRGTMLAPEDDGLLRLRLGGMALPVLYALVASTA
jgi:SAM-dependent methyltransferase